MKIHTIAIVLFLMDFTGATAQAGLEKWPALNQFHEVLSQTYHPAQEGNLVPIKERSEELYNKSVALLASDIPGDFRTNNMLRLAEKLQLKSRELNKLVLAKAPDVEITNALEQVHNTFHEMAGMCSDKK